MIKILLSAMKVVVASSLRKYSALLCLFDTIVSDFYAKKKLFFGFAAKKTRFDAVVPCSLFDFCFLRLRALAHLQMSCENLM